MLAEQVALLRGQLKVLADAKAPSDDSGAKLVLTSAPAPASAESSSNTAPVGVAAATSVAAPQGQAMQKRHETRPLAAQAAMPGC